jgi:hypothetical protein
MRDEMEWTANSGVWWNRIAVGNGSPGPGSPQKKLDPSRRSSESKVSDSKLTTLLDLYAEPFKRVCHWGFVATSWWRLSSSRMMG